MKDLFLDRKEEMALFRHLLGRSSKFWLLWMVGGAGKGKTTLIRRFYDECKTRRFRSVVFVDFYDVHLRTKVGMLSYLAHSLYAHSSDFSNTIAFYGAEIAKGELADRGVADYWVRRAEDALLAAEKPKRRGSQPVIVFADTVEEIAKLDLANWFFLEFLPRLKPDIRVVAAGRTLPWRCVKELKAEAREIQVDKTSLSLGDVKYYCHGLKLDTFLTKDEVVRLHKFTAGEPFELVLVSDLLLRGLLDRAQFNELLDSGEPGLGQRLSDWVAALTDKANEVIALMAHLVHWPMDTSMLGYLTNWSAEECRAVLREVASFLVVRRRVGKEDEYVLHDYIREWIQIRYWGVQDRDLTLRKAISAKLATFFERRLRELKNADGADIPQIDTITHQWLYHLLFADRERVYGELWEILDRSWHAYKYDYMDELLDMVAKVNREIFKPVGNFDLVLDRLEKAARVWMYLETWRTEDALELSEDLVANPVGMRRIHATATVARGTALGRFGHTDEAIRLLRQAYDEYERLLQFAQVAEKGDPEAKESLKSEHGIATVHGIQPERYLILNTIGVLERRRGRFVEAENEFRESLRLSQNEQDWVWVASAATQIGNVLRYKGDLAGAHDYIQKGIELREQLKQRGLLAFSLQPMGMLLRDEGRHREAREYFDRAFNIWKELGAKGDLAGVIRNFGWLDYIEGNYDAAEKHFSEAEEIYKELEIVREFPNLRHKQARLWIAKSLQASNKALRENNLKKASDYLEDGLKYAEKYEDPLFAANCLVDLCRIAEMQRQYERIPELGQAIRSYEGKGYSFLLTYADLEFIEGDVTYQKAQISDAEFDQGLLDEAADHYANGYLYLTRYQTDSYRERLDFLRTWLTRLPQETKRSAAQHIIKFWEDRPEVAAIHPEIIQTCKILGEL